MAVDRPFYWTVKRPEQPVHTIYSQTAVLNELAKPGPVDIERKPRDKKYVVAVGEHDGEFRQQSYADFVAAVDTAGELWAEGTHAFVNVLSISSRSVWWANGNFTSAAQEGS